MSSLSSQLLVHIIQTVGTYDRLNVKLNCQVDRGGLFPFSSDTVTPSWMILSMSTLHLMVW